MSLSDDILAAMVKREKSRPRSQQIHLGPSELGSCREYVRNVLAGSPRLEDPNWQAAAVVGTLVGDYMEDAVKEYMGAKTQVPISTQLPNGLIVAGHADMVFPDRNQLADCKSKNGFSSVLAEGPSLENLIQVSIYTFGCVQNGYLEEGAEAVLVYVDRSGDKQTLHEYVLTWEEIVNYVDICVDRLDEVLEAQDHIDKGEVEWARTLRDKTPPFCYSEKVMCPFRDLCWKGSEWVPDEQITDPETIEAVSRYVAARQKESDAKGEKSWNREKLRGISGMTPDGYSVTWPDGERALYVTKVKHQK